MMGSKIPPLEDGPIRSEDNQARVDLCPHRSPEITVSGIPGGLAACSLVRDKTDQSIARSRLHCLKCQFCGGGDDIKSNGFLQLIILQNGFNALVSAPGKKPKTPEKPTTRKILEVFQEYRGDRVTKSLVDSMFYHHTIDGSQAEKLVRSYGLVSPEDMDLVHEHYAKAFRPYLVPDMTKEELESSPSDKEIEDRKAACFSCPLFTRKSPGLYGCRGCKGCTKKGSPRKLVFNAPLRVFDCPKKLWKLVRGEVWLIEREKYRTPDFERVKLALGSSGYSPRIIKEKDLREALDGVNGNPPLATLRWDEHLNLFSTGKNLEILRETYEKGIIPLSIDYGYFGHYRSYMVDRYISSGVGTIRLDWDELPTIPQWGEADHVIRKYRERVLENSEVAYSMGPLLDPGYVCIWSPSVGGHCREPFAPARKERSQFLVKLVEKVRENGLVPVIKGSPIKNSFKLPEGVPVFKKGPKYPDQNMLNLRLALHASNNIIITSSVSNEMVILDLPVTALGHSWFTGLGVFYEPSSWEDVGPPVPINQEARARWINWWIRRQAPRELVALKFMEMVKK